MFSNVFNELGKLVKSIVPERAGLSVGTEDVPVGAIYADSLTVDGNPIEGLSQTVIQGTATLVDGTVTVEDASVEEGQVVHITRQVSGGTVGHLTAVAADGEITISSSSATETSEVGYLIIPS